MLPFDTRTRDFHGKAVTTVTFDGLPAWVARHIGALLDYPGHGKRLVHKILGEWNAEFEEGHDYFFLDGASLAALRTIGAEGPVFVSHHPRDSVLFLLEPGLHLVLEKTRRPVAEKLRHFLLDEVLAEIPGYVPGDLADGIGLQSPKRETIDVVFGRSLAERQEERLWLEARTQARRVDLGERRFRVEALRHFGERLVDSLSPAARVALELRIAEIATGLDLFSLLGPDDGDDSPTDGRLDEEAA